MALKKLPLSLQSKFRASSHIRTFKTAVEELVYNALDAGSSSIAIRLDTKENYIQVVDNGHGVAKEDFSLIGQRYTTSKFEYSTSESVSMYGCYGQSLANLIEVSQSVKIISKCVNNNETWMKYFQYGKEEACSIIAERPSVGTTVEVKGFLYNLTLQKKTLNAWQELENIKTCLEKMSLIHCNTSISLRDNSANEIILKIHKKRDVIQTMSSVLNISPSNMREFQVEKNRYKVTGFIKNNNEETKGYQWIYVNGRFIHNSHLYQMVNKNLVKDVPGKNNNKNKICNYEEEKLIIRNNKLPDYFLFIRCPKSDYDIVSNPKQSILEFKSVVQINQLLDKLLKFYLGDIDINSVKPTKMVTNLENGKLYETDTRDKVKQIMQKILGSQQKKMNGSNLHNGVKGKIIKRKDKKNNRSLVNNKLNLEDNNGQKEEMFENKVTSKQDNNTVMASFQVPKSIATKIRKENANKKQIEKENHSRVTNKAMKNKHHQINKEELVLSKFEKDTDEVNKRCNLLSKKVDQLLGVKKRRKCKVFTNDTVHYSNIITNDKSITVRKRINEIIIHEYVPLPKKIQVANKQKKIVNYIKTSDDLVRPVANIINQKNVPRIGMCFKPSAERLPGRRMQVADINDVEMPGPTYESHGYLKYSQIARPQAGLVNKCKKNQFISKTSREYLASPMATRNRINKRKPTKKLHNNTVRGKVPEVVKSSYSIHLTETCPQSLGIRQTTKKSCDVMSKETNNELCIGCTYTVACSEKVGNVYSKTISPDASIIESVSYEVNPTSVPNVNICHKKSPEPQNTQKDIVLTDDKVENDIVFISNSQFVSSGIEPLKLCEAVISCPEEREREEFTKNTANIDSVNNANENNVSNESSGTPIEDFIEIKRGHKRIYSIHEEKLTENGLINDLHIRIGDCDEDDNNLEPKLIENGLINDLHMKIGDCEQDDNNLEPKLIENGLINDLHTRIGDCDQYCNNLEPKFIGNGSISNLDMRISDCDPDENTLEPKLIENSLMNDLHMEIGDCDPDVNNLEPNNFNLKIRRRYIPKGMSPIFENSNLKTAFNNELYEDYFGETVYNEFAQNVQLQTEIFEPNIQNLKETTTRDIQRVNVKLNKDNASLTFNAKSLKDAKVLGQVDGKFIASIMNGDSNGAHDSLILFDQHAVHERIRLEQNVADYITGDQWKSESVDGFLLKLSKDEIPYLHNYRDKFKKLGIQWSSASDTQVLVNTIPVAILGKHPRQVDVVLKAVESLIKEEITIIKEQGGCVSLYPKSIMDLIFSEACRYAIMFGTVLSKRECSSLIESLSRCRTPFQCAHGRPALAVLVDVVRDTRPYVVNIAKVEEFCKRTKTLNK